MSCSAYQFMWDESEVCHRQYNDEDGYGTCYCQGDETHCPLPYEDDEEIVE